MRCFTISTKTIGKYHFFIGVYDHKLGPICACPIPTWEWLKSTFENALGLIQDGLNTKSKVFTIKNTDYFVQIVKFYIEDNRFRGGKLKCSLFCMIPTNKSLIPDDELNLIIDGFLNVCRKADIEFSNPICETFILEKEAEYNNRLDGEIGSGQMEYKMHDLMNAIVGYAQILEDEILGPLNEDQKEGITYILKYAKELLILKQPKKEYNT